MWTGLLLIILTAGGCDVCQNSSGGGPQVSYEIYFSSVPVNSTQPSIFRVSPGGSDLTEIIKNGIIFSPPSTGSNLIAFFRSVSTTNGILMTSDINGNNIQAILPGGHYQTLQNPVLSPDGRMIAFGLGGHELFIITSDGSFGAASKNFLDSSLPAFSPDGSKIAYFETKNQDSTLSVVVLNTQNLPPSTVGVKYYNIGVSNYFDKPTISWSFSGKDIIYTLSQFNLAQSATTDYIYENPPDNSLGLGIPVQNVGAFMPVLSPDEKYFAYAGRDGNIWYRNTSLTDGSYVKVTQNDTTEFCLYPQWSPDGVYILFTKYFVDDNVNFHGSLEMANIITGAVTIVSNNAWRGFWVKK